MCETDLAYGLYDQLIDSRLAAKLPGATVQIAQARLDNEQHDDERQARLIAVLQRELAVLLDELPAGPNRGQAELELITQLLRTMRQNSADNAEVLTFPEPLAVLQAIASGNAPLPHPPTTGLRCSWLFTAGKGDPALLQELRSELACVDQVDVLVSFITWSGVRKIADLLDGVTSVGADGQGRTRFRVLTTTYTGATEARAVQYLAQLPGVEVRVSLDGRRSRLHAKAWIFHRATGFGSAYIGSANLSAAALTGGLEWTVKLAQQGDPTVFDRACAHFETLWNDPEFGAYDPTDPTQQQELKQALARERYGQGDAEPELPTWFTIQPKAYQQMILDRLDAERRHGRKRNLLVAATGTGKTVIAAFDYLQSCRTTGGLPRLLFIAHRKEILQQARATFAQVLRKADFGELLADGREPASFEHLFSTIQSFNRRGLLAQCGLAYWHTVIVDECHHAAAVSYSELLQHVQPQLLLGLTATPERADGQFITHYFDQRPDGSSAAELRLWDALEQQLLCPFEYYGCADDTDLGAVPWDCAEEKQYLSGLLTGNYARAMIAINAFLHYCSAPRQARALAFCVTVEHAQFMAKCFCEAGIPAEVVVGDQSVTSRDQRRRAPEKLCRGEVNVLCTCDLYNEGIDLPEVDTLLFLRPTQSPVVFQQQLGRGLRLAHDKASCLVIDLVGRYRDDFRFDRIYGVLTGLSRTQLLNAASKGFDQLPPGCHIQLDRIARERVLASLRHVAQHNWRSLTRELQAYAMLKGRNNLEFAKFLYELGLELPDLYGATSSASTPRGWTALCRNAGLLTTPAAGPYENSIASKLANLLALDDPGFLTTALQIAEASADYDSLDMPTQRQADILAGELFPNPIDPCSGSELTTRLQHEPAIRSELQELLTLLIDKDPIAPTQLPGCPPDWPLCLHAAYSLRALALATGKIPANSRHLPREGVVRFPEQKLELLLVTLDKSAGFSTRTAYHDYAISPKLFHWQTQNSCGADTTAGQRYLHGYAKGWVFQLFVRTAKREPYRALGPVTLAKAEGNRPMSITWRLQLPMSTALFSEFSVLRGAGG